MELVITLSDKTLDDLAAAAGGKIVITGRMTSFDPDPDTMAEILFSGSDLVVGGIETGVPKPFLELTSVPGPNGLLLSAIVLTGTIFRRRRPS